MTDDKKEITIKDFLTHYPSLILMGVIAVLSLYIGSVIAPLSNRIDVLAKDVQMNRDRVEKCDTLQETVVVNSTKLDTILDRLDRIDNSLHNSR